MSAINKKELTKHIAVISFSLLIIFILISETKKKDDSERRQTNTTVNNNNSPKLDSNIDTLSVERIEPTKRKFHIEEVTSYYNNPYANSVNIKTYYYGLYIDLLKDTTGIEDAIMNYLYEKSRIAAQREAVHLWFFTDKKIIPKSFEGEEWSIKRKQKCFAHAEKNIVGEFFCEYNPLGQFKQ